MRIKMLRNVAGRPELIEGRVSDVSDEDGAALLAAQLAEPPAPPKSARRRQPDPTEPGTPTDADPGGPAGG